MTEYLVARYEDLEGVNLSSRGKDRVIQELHSGEYDIVVWVEGWLLREEDKHYETLESADRLLGAVEVVESRSGKAWGIIQQEGEEPDWAPKSCSEVYKRHPNRGIEEINTPQTGLQEFG